MKSNFNKKTVDTMLPNIMTSSCYIYDANLNENMDDLMETLDLWIQNNAEIYPVYLYSVCWKSFIL
jgi:hypothetical protein